MHRVAFAPVLPILGGLQLETAKVRAVSHNICCLSPGDWFDENAVILASIIRVHPL